VNYKSFFNKDYKNAGHPALNPIMTRLKRRHVLIVASIAGVCAMIVTFASLDVSAKKHDVSATLNQTGQITLPLAIPKSSELTLTEALQEGTPEDWLTAEVKKGDSLSAIFFRHDLNASDLHQIMSLGKDTKCLTLVRPGQHFRIRVNSANEVQALHYDISRLESLLVQRDGDHFVAQREYKSVEIRTQHATAKIKSSLFEAGREAGLSDSITMDIAHIFGWDIDFGLDIRDGDQFTVVYEEKYLAGSKIGDGSILGAEFINQGVSYKAIRYTDADDRSDYYSPEGLSMRKAFLRTPVDFFRISSRFGKRKHPILNNIRMHKGVDYAAARGTPIKSAGDGKVIVKQHKNGYGRTIMIQHGGRYSTLYAHMQAYKSGIHVGKRVKQGQVIGYVGSSGRATGPHLHYEFRVNGVHRNPLTISLPHAKPIDKKFKSEFITHAQAMMDKINMFKETYVALNTP